MTTAEVRLWGTKIGAVSIGDDSPYGYFQYDPDFVKSGIPVSPLMMPLSDATYSFLSLSLESFHGLPGLLADSIPDKFGNAVIDAWLASIGRSKASFNVVERLCFIGKRGMGALEFFPSKSKDLSKDDEIRIDQLVGLSNEILSKKKSFSVNGKGSLQQLLDVGTSAGGARAKAIVAFNGKTNEFRSGQVEAGEGFSYWIIKFDGVGNNQDKDEDNTAFFTRVEYAYYLMALCAGIKMSESRLFIENNRYHFMTKRFDRIETGNGQIDKAHMQTLSALTHLDYNQPGSLSYEGACQEMGALGLSHDEIEQFFKRMVFNVMARNQDDHLKNISFLMDRKGTWSLSPAYDVTYAHNPDGKWTSAHQMRINGKSRDISLEDLKQSAAAMAIKPRNAEKIIAEVSEALTRWDDFAKKAFLGKKTADFIQNNFLFLR
jgi:serine/threonine-protein kinase HipA